ncbi:class I SAM-dependent DNA methyltransferase [Methylobacterium iners]|uniref:Trans-aconitate 2-methyltransferase n=1 Tax=Methylobacterium iners TaxID=418707 RepID=A0ABQ4RWR0_9HYPH|nr:methyltransferase domain-containing protein [Methylobacterium iners]GJD95285.1 Trans-aconitate 2-methyltransferase [Methylobacterium iners]
MSRQTSSGDLLADRRYAYAEACLAEGDAAGAAEMAEQALERAPRFAPAWFLLGRALEARHREGGALDDHHAALRAYANALDLDPDDGLGARLHLAQLGVGNALDAISPAYVRALFDGYADRFERHLVGDLHYRGPAMLRAALAAHAPPRFGDGLDLGCGTGLMGEALAGRVERLTGIDLSPAMLARAERTGRYHGLIEGDLTGFLAGATPDSFDLVLAADVFIYLGDLGPILAGIGRALRPGGLAAFTVQSQDGDGVKLGADARYAHGDAHLREAVASGGLELLTLEEAAIRRERGADVPGRIAIVRRPASSDGR